LDDRDELLTAAEKSLDLLAHWKPSLQIRIRGRDRSFMTGCRHGEVGLQRRGKISTARS
jgi:hypothetical protein